MSKKFLLLILFAIGLAFGQISYSELFRTFDYYNGSLGEPISTSDFMPSGKGNLRILMRNRFAQVDKYWDDELQNRQIKADSAYNATYHRVLHMTSFDYGATGWMDVGFRLPMMVQAADYLDDEPSYDADFGDFHFRLRAEPLSEIDYFWRSSIAAGLKMPTGNSKSHFINTGNGTFDITLFWYNMLDFDGSRIMFDVGYIITGSYKKDSSGVPIDIHNGDISIVNLAYDFDIYDGIIGGFIASGAYMDRTKVFYNVGGPHYRNDDSYTTTISPFVKAHIPGTPLSLSLGSVHTIQARNMPTLNGFQAGLQVDGKIWF